MAAMKKKLHVNKVTVDIGCGSCRKPKKFLSQIFNPKPKQKNSNFLYDHSPSSSSYSSEKKLNQGFVSVAVEKDSNDPYVDFRQSMLQMILENEIYSQEGLRELLSCFLHLNSPSNHGIIIRAFAEIWDGVICGKSTAAVAAVSPVKKRSGFRSRGF